MPEIAFASRPLTRAGRAQVFAAADRALQAGLRPTQDGIRRDLGGGSLGSINTHLNEWYRELGSRLTAAERPLPELPAEVSALLLQLWRLAQSGSVKTLPESSDVTALRLAHAEQEALRAQHQSLEVLNAELTRHRASAERALTDARALLARREAALEDERAARLDAEQAVAQLRMELQVLRERRTAAAPSQAPAVGRRRSSSKPTRKVTARGAKRAVATKRSVLPKKGTPRRPGRRIAHAGRSATRRQPKTRTTRRR